MTSQKYSANKYAAKFDLERCFKFNLIPALFMFIFSAICFIVNPLSELSNYGSLLNKVEIVQGTKNSVLCMLTGYSAQYSLAYWCIMFGIVFAVVNTVFMKKQNINFYFSTPVDRATLFKNRMISALTYITGILLITIAVDCVINIYYFSNPAYIIKLALALFAESLVYCFVSFIIFSIGIIACCTVVEGLIYGITLIYLPTIIVSAVDCVCRAFLRGYAKEDYMPYLNAAIFGFSDSGFAEKSLLVSTANFNPLYFGRAIGSQYIEDTIFNLCYNSSDNFLYGNNYSEDTLSNIKLEYWLPTMNYILPVIIWAIVFVALVFTARYLFIHKKAENTAIHGSNKLATLIFTLGIALDISTMVISLISSSWIEKYTYLAIIILLAVFVAVFFIFNAICTRKAILTGKTYIAGAVTGVCFAIICGILSLGGFGYSKYVPDVDDIEMATITSDGIVNTLHNEEMLSEYYYASPLYESNGSAFTIFTGKEDLTKFTEVAKSLAAESDNSVDTDIFVVYQLKNGKKVTREYTTADKNAVYGILSLTDTDAYKSQLEYLMLGDAKTKSEFAKNIEAFGYSEDNFASYYDYSYDSDNYLSYSKQIFDKGLAFFSHYGFDDEVEIENTTELKQAIYKDLAASTYEQRFSPDEKEVAQIKFAIVEYYDDEYYDDYYADDSEASEDEDYYEISSCIYRIYPSMTNTVNYLKSIGVYSESTNYFENQPTKAYITTVKDVKSSVYSNYMFESVVCYEDIYEDDYYDDTSYDYYADVYGEKTTDDADKIKSLMSVSRPYGYTDDDDIVILFVAKDDMNYTIYVPMLIKNADAPEWAKAE